VSALGRPALRALLAFAFAAGLVAPAAAADTNRGLALYVNYCSSCHNPGGNPGPELIRLGAGEPSTIALALDTVLEMEPYQALLKPADLEDLAAYLAVKFNVTPVAKTAQAIEYYHAVFDHFFVTTVADEITKLDNGTFAGWQRTGLSFTVYKAATVGTSPVCRFFSTAFAPKSSHFYTASPAECTAVKANPNWTFEGEVFWVDTPEDNGTCDPDEIPVYRVYNDGQGAAPNHRLTTSQPLIAEMVTKGWVPEGFGVGVTMCVPPPE
jgi:mono/diheme cytochrome c family protein